MLSKAKLKERNRQIVDLLRETNSDDSFCWTLQEIATNWDLTRERVRQIGVMAGLPNRHDVQDQKRQVMRDAVPKCTVEHCSNDVKIIEKPKLRYARNGRCVDHGRDMVLITCAWCGKESERERYHAYTDHRIRSNPFRTKPQKNWFCDNKCQGKFIGREYGFSAHPENSRGAQRGSMYGVSIDDLKASTDED